MDGTHISEGNGVTHNKKCTQQKAKDIAESTGGDPNVTEKQLTNRVRNKDDWSKVQGMIKESRNGGLNKLITPVPRDKSKERNIVLRKRQKKHH